MAHVFLSREKSYRVRIKRISTTYKADKYKADPRYALDMAPYRVMIISTERHKSALSDFV